MTEKNVVFSSKIGYDGIFSFPDFYKFCYGFLSDDLGFLTIEDAYKEKISGDAKELEVKWKSTNKIDDYFMHEIKIEFRIFNMKNIEVEKEGGRKKMNKGIVEIKVKGTVITDYRGEYTTSPVRRFMRNVYEKWIIPSRIEKVEEKLFGDCDEFLKQAKAYLDLEGKR